MKQPIFQPEVATTPPLRNTMGAAVNFIGLEKRYGIVRALMPTTLEILSGEFFAIIGPSGSGKSTLLGVTAGFIPSSAGQILVNGRDLVGEPPYTRNIGMVFQNYSLFPHMTVAENIAFPLKMRGKPAAEIDGKVARMLEAVRLSGFGARRPQQLSGGQQQRVALARAAVYDPLLLLMDEPLGALDKNLREEMQEEIKRFQAAIGTTVIYVTHDQQEAACMADRIAVMNNGAIIQIATPRELYENPRTSFVASFLGEANLMKVEQITGGGVNGCTARVLGGHIVRTASTILPATPSALLVRPENIMIGDERGSAENRFPGVISDVVYTAGSVRYRVRLGGDLVLTVRVPSRHGIVLQALGDAVTVAWRASDTIIVAEEG
ncbi:MAG TPA: ABC transporter ATP-binding protein [Aestuariivirgaceae bacterium]|jgi:putative spermidine/putrescine transport system ATP-binding protein|nr:ABC transporter ATP-binding protein [Aestuariivirgaceae bacterium]